MGAGDRQGRVCVGAGTVVLPTRTRNPSLCRARRLPVQVCWRQEKVDYAWLQAKHFFIEFMGEKTQGLLLICLRIWKLQCSWLW